MKRLLAFVTGMFLATVLCTALWQMLVTNRLYNCTDPGVFDFLRPGHWVHGKIALVPEVRTGRSMNEPDTIKQGWSMFRLYCLWVAMWGFSLSAGFIAAKSSGNRENQNIFPSVATIN